MRRSIFLVAFAYVVLSGGGGGGGGSSNNNGTKLAIVVSITPTQPSISLNGAQQFAATVANSSNQAVSWSVQEGATGGTVSPTGLYQAPQNAAGAFHVSAASQADPTKSASVPVLVHLGISASAPSATLTLGQSQTFIQI